MTIVRSRKARILEKAGLRYVAGWIDAKDAPDTEAKIDAAKAKIAEALRDD